MMTEARWKCTLCLTLVIFLAAAFQPGVMAMDTSAPLRTPLWTFQTGGAVWSSPAVANGVVYFGSDDGNLYAVSIPSGEARWKFETGGLVRSRPALAGDSVYFASDDGFLYAVTAESGQQQWKLDIGNAAVKRLHPANDYNWDYLQSSPVVVDGVIYIGSADGAIYAVNAGTGKTQWQFKTEDRVRATPAVAGGIVYVGSWDGFVYALDAQTGQERWRYDSRQQYIHIQSSPTVVNGVVYTGSRSSNLYVFDAQTGEKLWAFRYKLEWVESTPAVVDGVVYCGSSLDSRLYAIDSATGKLKWDFLFTGVAFSSPAVAGGVVYIGEAYWDKSRENYFYAIDIEAGQAAGHLLHEQALWKVEIDPSLDKSPTKMQGVVSSPAISDGVVYFGGMDGKLYAVSTES